MFDSFTVIQTSFFVGMIWLLAVNDINLVYKVKNQTNNRSPCFYLASSIQGPATD